MIVKKVKYIFMVLYLILLVLNITIGLKHTFLILMGLVVIQTIAYTIAERADKRIEADL